MANYGTVPSQRIEKKLSRSTSNTGSRRVAQPTEKELERYPHEDHVELDGTLKAFVFGFNDGLSANTCLMLGIASASSVHPHLVLASGLVGLLSGAASMAAGEWISGTLANSAERGEVLKEQGHLKNYAKEEAANFRENVTELGFSPKTITAMLQEMDASPALAVKAHCKFEMGLDDVWDDEAGAPSEAGGSIDTIKSMAMMMFAFSSGALVPLVPWLLNAASPGTFGSPHVLLIASLVLALSASFIVGSVVANAFCAPSDKVRITGTQSGAVLLAIAAVYLVGLAYQHFGGSLTAATEAG